ncbi:MAG: hypothetical protein IIC21_08655 [Chloroflexi bacterium]|nr:hypothetical protein [Chloroflexota bacterium]
MSDAKSAFQTAYDEGLKTLNADASWQQLDDVTEQTILGQVSLALLPPPVTKTNEDVLGELERSSLDARVSGVAAVSERVVKAIPDDFADPENDANAVLTALTHPDNRQSNAQ